MGNGMEWFIIELEKKCVCVCDDSLFGKNEILFLSCHIDICSISVFYLRVEHCSVLRILKKKVFFSQPNRCKKSSKYYRKTSERKTNNSYFMLCKSFILILFRKLVYWIICAEVANDKWNIETIMDVQIGQFYGCKI